MRLQLQNLTRRFRDQIALDNITLTIESGELISVVGPSGCGKTTLLRAIAGLETVDGGSIELDGVNQADRSPRQRDIAMVFQGESLYPHMSVFDNLAFPLKMRRTSPEETRSRVIKTAKQLTVDDLLDRMPNTLSGGQRQRVAIGRALVRNPKLFLFDEPFSDLDAHLRRQLCRELQELRKSWAAASLFVTHDQNEALALGDRMAVMNAGKILQLDVPDQILSNPATDFVGEFMDVER